MYQGTTPTYLLKIDGYDLTDKRVFVTIQGKFKRVTKTDDDLTITYEENVSAIAFGLTQEETLGFEPGAVKMQVRFIDANGIALATEVSEIEVKPVLFRKVIAYEPDEAEE